MTELPDPEEVVGKASAFQAWLIDDILTLPVVLELVAVAAALSLSLALAPWIAGWVGAWTERGDANTRFGAVTRSLVGGLVEALAPLTLPIVWMLLQGLSVIVAWRAGFGRDLLLIAVELLAAWVAIHLFSRIIRDPFWSGVARVVAWSIVALDILGFLDETAALLDGPKLSIGSLRLSLLTVLTGLLWLYVLLRLAAWISRLLERRFQAASTLTPSAQLVVTRLMKVGLIIAAIFVALGSVGIDLTALAVFSGAVGVGIGFGLQAIFNSFVAGIILLWEKTLKVGDFVELEKGLAGTVRRIDIRNTVITTPLNLDVSVPNSEFVNGRITNWTLLEPHARIRVPFSVGYGSDEDRVCEIVLATAREVRFTLPEEEGRTSQVWLLRLGESRLEFELVVWLTAEGIHKPEGAHAPTVSPSTRRSGKMASRCRFLSATCTSRASRRWRWPAPGQRA